MSRRRGRGFELLVAMLEAHLAPLGAVVQSPDHLLDNTTGKMREVDASIRYQVASVPILITIECRDRADRDDVRWIEQLATKRNALRANATIAVSRKGFSAPAVLAARCNTIEVRTFEEVSEEAIADWARSFRMIVFSGRFVIDSLRFGLRGDFGGIHPDLSATWSPRPLADTPIMRSCVDGTAVSIGALLRRDDVKAGITAFASLTDDVTVTVEPGSTATVLLGAPYPGLFVDVPQTGEVVKKDRLWEFEEGEFEVRSEHGYASVGTLEVGLSAKYIALPSNVGQLLAYKKPSDESAIALVERREVDTGFGKSQTLVIAETKRTRPTEREPGNSQ